MGQAARDGRCEVLDPVHEVDRDLSLLAEGVATDAVGVGSLSDRASISGEFGTSKERENHLGSDKEVTEEEPEGVEGEGKLDQQKTSDTMYYWVDQGTSYSSNNLSNQEVLETVVVIEPVQTECVYRDHRKLEVKVDESELSKVSIKAPKEVSETNRNSCVVDIKCSNRKKFSESSEGEMICRICHLTSGRPSGETAVGTTDDATSTDLIQLGCACKDELGISHIHCAEAWFKLKGNRLCEICGETAKNVSGVADIGFMEEWHEGRFMDIDNPSRRRNNILTSELRGGNDDLGSENHQRQTGTHAAVAMALDPFAVISNDNHKPRL